MSEVKYKWVCGNCGSDRVSCSAPVTWDVETQDWIAGIPYDDDFCEDCDSECRSFQEVIEE